MVSGTDDRGRIIRSTNVRTNASAIAKGEPALTSNLRHILHFITFFGWLTVSLIQLTLQCAGPLHLTRKRFSGEKRMLKRDMTIANYDPQLWQAITDETRRQEEHIELIASENYTSPRVMEAQGSQLTNKYAEGYPAKRYYGGCEYVDVVETLAIGSAPRNCLVPLTPTCSRIPAPRPTAPFTWLVLQRVTPCWDEPGPWWSLTHGSPQLLRQAVQHHPYGIDESGKMTMTKWTSGRRAQAEDDDRWFSPTQVSSTGPACVNRRQDWCLAVRDMVT